jgi:hypothetical protein
VNVFERAASIKAHPRAGKGAHARQEGTIDLGVPRQRACDSIGVIARSRGRILQRERRGGRIVSERAQRLDRGGVDARVGSRAWNQDKGGRMRSLASVVLFETSLRGERAHGLNVVEYQPDWFVRDLTVFFRPLAALQLVAEVVGGHMAQRFGPREDL